MLHLVFQSTVQTQKLEQCFRFITVGDDICLLEEAVVALQHQPSLKKIQQLLSEQAIGVYASQADLLARGIDATEISWLKIIDYDQLVDLTLQHETNQSW